MPDDGPDRNEAVLVLGAGVSGLTCALVLKKRAGFGVTVLAENFAPRVTSVVAGALWEWPPAVCGYHQDQQSLLRSKGWCMASYSRFAQFAREPSSGVFMRTATFYFKQPVDDEPVAAHGKCLRSGTLSIGFVRARSKL